ncbi:hypothetical protein [Actinocorallia aurantiaca]|uniref:Uncharacterized protein n=1 Tax=Actinocorallia aurantiaca TaxID=46204 RepID=A0ABP6H5P2_9ACTN
MSMFPLACQRPALPQRMPAAARVLADLAEEALHLPEVCIWALDAIVELHIRGQVSDVEAVQTWAAHLDGTVEHESLFHLPGSALVRVRVERDGLPVEIWTITRVPLEEAS